MRDRVNDNGIQNDAHLCDFVRQPGTMWLHARLGARVCWPCVYPGLTLSVLLLPLAYVIALLQDAKVKVLRDNVTNNEAMNNLYLLWN